MAVPRRDENDNRITLKLPADDGNGSDFPAIGYSVLGINMFCKRSMLIVEPIFLQR